MKNQKALQILSLASLLALLALATSCSSGPDTAEDGGDSVPAETDESMADASTDEVPPPEAPADETPPSDVAAGPVVEDEAARLADQAALAQVTVPSPDEAPAGDSEAAKADALAAAPDSGSMDAPPPPMATESYTPPSSAPAPAPRETRTARSAPSFASNGSTPYRVQRGDTLMTIAFETYGDLFLWRRIYDQNRDRVQDPNQLVVGSTLIIESPSSPVTVERNGDRYRIKTGDTLGTISRDVYGTPTKWKRLWHNNRQLIRDPNRIFAGFTLYYTMTPEERELLPQQQPETQPQTLTQSAPPSYTQSNRAPASVPAYKAPAAASPLPGGGPFAPPAN